ncbi:MAG: response regulator transcription factor [Solirubrobacterales bacterium]|nr:response regulator transcription factor [Solirubrobacterales bacterium]
MLRPSRDSKRRACQVAHVDYKALNIAPPALRIWPRNPYGVCVSSLLQRTRAKVLVVEDEPAIADVVSRYLRRAGYETAVAGTGQQALGRAEATQPDVVVLDLMLPDIDGLEVMRRLRRADHGRGAIILLTARGEESDRIVGLRLGADDYVVKPFSPAELVARVDAVLRRIDPIGQREPPLCFDGLEIDPAAREVLRDGDPLELTQREFDLLLFLARHPGQAFTRDQLMEHVWHYTFYIDASTVTVHIRRLRAKLEPDSARPRFIQTVWGVGYRFAP